MPPIIWNKIKQFEVQGKTIDHGFCMKLIRQNIKSEVHRVNFLNLCLQEENEISSKRYRELEKLSNPDIQVIL